MIDLNEKIKAGRQYRNVKDVRALEQLEGQEKKYIVEGYAATFNEPYLLYAGEDYEYWEKIDSRAFDKADFTDYIMQYNHEGHVYARNKNNTLLHTIDEHGLFIRADLSGTQIGRDLYEEIRGKYTDKMSFGFTIKADELLIERKDGKTIYIDTLKEIGKVYDVSAVSIPANDGTEISARSRIDGLINKNKLEQAERLDEEKRKRFLLSLEF